MFGINFSFKIAIIRKTNGNENMKNEILIKLLEAKRDTAQKQYERANAELKPNQADITKARIVYFEYEDLINQINILLENEKTDKGNHG